MKIKKTDKTVLLAGLLWFAQRDQKLGSIEMLGAKDDLENAIADGATAKRIDALTKKLKGLLARQKSLNESAASAERNLKAESKKAKGDPISYGVYNTITVENGDTVQFKIGDDTFGHEILMATINGKRLNIRGGLVRGGGITVFPMAQNVIEVQP